MPNNNKAQSKEFDARLLPNKILIVSNVRGHYSKLEQLITKLNAKAVIHTGDFGFLTRESITYINERLLKHHIQSSFLINSQRKNFLADYPSLLLRKEVKISELTEFTAYLNKQKQFSVPIYTVYGSTDDVTVIEKAIDKGVYNLFILDQQNSYLLNIGNTKLRLLGLGGAWIRNKMFDHGFAKKHIPGSNDGTWVTLIQMGEIIELSRKHSSPNEIRIFMSHYSASKEPMLAQLANEIQADYYVFPSSGQLNNLSFTQYSVDLNINNFSDRLNSSLNEFKELWEVVKPHYQIKYNAEEMRLVQLALSIIGTIPRSISDKNNLSNFFTSTWQMNAPDLNIGYLVFNILDYQIGLESHMIGLNFVDRKPKFEDIELKGPIELRNGKKPNNQIKNLIDKKTIDNDKDNLISNNSNRLTKNENKKDNHFVNDNEAQSKAEFDIVYRTGINKATRTISNSKSNLGKNESSAEQLEINTPIEWADDVEEEENKNKAKINENAAIVPEDVYVEGHLNNSSDSKEDRHNTTTKGKTNADGSDLKEELDNVPLDKVNKSSDRNSEAANKIPIAKTGPNHIRRSKSNEPIKSSDSVGGSDDLNQSDSAEIKNNWDIEQGKGNKTKKNWSQLRDDNLNDYESNRIEDWLKDGDYNNSDDPINHEITSTSDSSSHLKDFQNAPFEIANPDKPDKIFRVLWIEENEQLKTHKIAPNCFLFLNYGIMFELDQTFFNLFDGFEDKIVLICLFRYKTFGLVQVTEPSVVDDLVIALDNKPYKDGRHLTASIQKSREELKGNTWARPHYKNFNQLQPRGPTFKFFNKNGRFKKNDASSEVDFKTRWRAFADSKKINS